MIMFAHIDEMYDYVRTSHFSDDWRWCRIDDKGYSEFEHEDYNGYSGGTTLSRTDYKIRKHIGHDGTPWNSFIGSPEDEIPTQEYWGWVQQKLDYHQEHDIDFCHDIMDMLKQI